MEQAASPFIGESKMQQLSQHRSRRVTRVGGWSRAVWRGESGSSAMISQRQSPPLRMALSLSPLQSRRVSTLAAFARAARQQFQVLQGVEVTASLHRAVEGLTRLASLLPVRRG